MKGNGTPFLTEPYLDDVRLRKLWPPYDYAMNAQLLVLLPRTALQREGSPWAEALVEDDWFLDAGGPCLVLGEAVLRPDGNYHPDEVYAVEDILYRTRLYRKPQREAEKNAMAAKQRAADKQKLQALRDQQYRQAAEAERRERQRLAALRSSDPMKEIELMKQRLAQLEGERGAALAEGTP
jgi:hypothetical protein